MGNEFVLQIRLAQPSLHGSARAAPSRSAAMRGRSTSWTPRTAGMTTKRFARMRRSQTSSAMPPNLGASSERSARGSRPAAWSRGATAAVSFVLCPPPFHHLSQHLSWRELQPIYRRLKQMAFCYLQQRCVRRPLRRDVQVFGGRLQMQDY